MLGFTVNEVLTAE